MKSNMQIYRYNKDHFELNEKVAATDLVADAFKKDVQWLNFHGFANKELINDSFDLFGIHKLTRDDIINLEERPKMRSMIIISMSH